VAFGLQSFKTTQLGRRVGAIVEHPQIVGDMIALSRHGMPAVQAVGRELLSLGPEVRDDQIKKTIGRWVREILEQHGWTVWRTRRVPPGNLFSTGMVYRLRTQPSPHQPGGEDGSHPLSLEERVALWRAGLEGLPQSEPLSDEAISRENIYADRG